MTESNTTPPADEHADEPLTWNADPAKPGPAGGTSAAASLLESLREAIDDMTERATPTVREISARVAEITAEAAAKAAPFAKKAGDATAEASGKFAERSRTWAAEMRASMPGGGPDTSAGTAPTATTEAPPVADEPSNESEPAEPPTS
jgi:hypothetical protein